MIDELLASRSGSARAARLRRADAGDRLYSGELDAWAARASRSREIVDRAGPEWLGQVGVVTQLLDRRDWRGRPGGRVPVRARSG